MKKYIIGIDVGGTNVKMGLIDNTGKVIARDTFETKKYSKNKNKLINALVISTNALLDDNAIARKNVLGVGVGMPGLIDPQQGIVKILTNMPGWKNVQLKKILEDKLSLRVMIDNDVNLITLGEWKYGAGKGYSDLVCLTMGTGVGGGLILNNSIYRGAGFAAGEVGHIPLNEKGPACACGGEACFERYVGNQYILQKVIKLFKNKNLRLEDVFDLANKGNVRAIEFWNDIGRHTGHALVGIINLLNPRLIIIGGGVSKSYAYIIKVIKKEVNKRAMRLQSGMVKITRAKLDTDATLFGALVLIQEKASGKKTP